ncbi:DUF3006 family protein [Vibrio vulnificus]|nr:DUF3006 family protein [Vibrio vulnificus]
MFYEKKEKIAVVEIKGGEMKNIPKLIIPKEAKGGDMLIIEITNSKGKTENQEKKLMN